MILISNTSPHASEPVGLEAWIMHSPPTFNLIYFIQKSRSNKGGNLDHLIIEAMIPNHESSLSKA